MFFSLYDLLQAFRDLYRFPCQGFHYLPEFDRVGSRQDDAIAMCAGFC